MLTRSLLMPTATTPTISRKEQHKQTQADEFRISGSGHIEGTGYALSMGHGQQ